MPTKRKLKVPCPTCDVPQFVRDGKIAGHWRLVGFPDALILIGNRPLTAPCPGSGKPVAHKA